MEQWYAAIDLKSFYASAECLARGLDPMKTNLLVADPSRTEKTICLAVSPSLKAWGISGRARLFEAVEAVALANARRQLRAPGGRFSGSSYDADALAADPSLKLDYITAPPRMGEYMRLSTQVYQVYLKYVAPEDIHVYSVDEVFLYLTPYLRVRGQSPREFVSEMVRDVLETTGLTAAAGIGTNLYLCKVAMDIVAKHEKPDAHGARIAELTQESYRRLLWDHTPLTDFWRVGRGYVRRLETLGIRTMGEIARCSLGKPEEFYNESLLYQAFGVNAELLIDHAWGEESCRIPDIKAYRPAAKSLGSGQVLTCPYPFHKARLVLSEMADALALDLVDKGLETDQLVLTVGYDVENLKDPRRRAAYRGEVVTDVYGRQIPRHAHGTANLPCPSASSREIIGALQDLFDKIADKSLLIRRMNITAARVRPAGLGEETLEQLDLFGDFLRQAQARAAREKEKRRQQAVLTIRHKYGKNAILRGMSYLDGATARERNGQIGGHKA